MRKISTFLLALIAMMSFTMSAGSGIFLRGGMNSWNAEAAWEFQTTATTGVYTLENVSFGGAFKIADATWSDACNWGGSSIQVGNPCNLVAKGDNLNLADVYDFSKITLTIKTDGTATLLMIGKKQAATALTKVYVIGNITNWNFNDSTGMLKQTADGSGIFEGTLTLPSSDANDPTGLSYWRIYEKLGQVGCWGPAEKDSVNTTSGTLVKAETDNGVTTTAGTYNFHFEIATGAFTLTKVATLESDTLYETTNGITCVNKWLMCNNLNKTELQKYAYLNTNKCRTACLHNGVIYVGNSTNDDATIVDEKGNAVDCCGIETFDAATGAHLGHLKVSYNGRRISGLLCANQVGFDNFGHLYVAGYVASNANGYTVYVVDPATGVASDSLHFNMTNAGRIDYCDVVGDLTRVNANCTVMAAADPPAADATVYRWSAAKGGAFAGGWNEDGDDSFVMSELYPATQTTWSYASIVRMVLGEGDAMYNGDLFYVDGFNTYPTLYNTTGGIVDSFANAVDLTPKNAGTNGVNEIQLGDKHFIVYSNNQHTGDQGGNEAEVCQLGEGDAFTGMTHYWQIPKHGLGMTSDTGTRIHCISKEYVKDANGKLACNILVFKTMNGMGLYQIAEDGFNPGGVKAVNAAPAAVITVNGGIITVSATASSIAIYNVAGQLVSMVKNASQVAAPANGLYIVKAVVNGQSIVKKVVL